jgi:hypothetical protein
MRAASRARPVGRALWNDRTLENFGQGVDTVTTLIELDAVATVLIVVNVALSVIHWRAIARLRGLLRDLAERRADLAATRAALEADNERARASLDELVDRLGVARSSSSP